MTTLYLGGETHILKASVDLTSGPEPLLAIESQWFFGKMPSFLAFSKSGSQVLAILEEDDLLVLLERDPTGALTKLGEQSCPGGPAYVAFDATGRWALTASYGSGESRLYPVEPKALGPARSTFATGTYSHCILPSPDGRALYVPSKGTDTIASIAFDPAAGQAQLGTSFQAPSGSGPRHLVFTKDGKRAFVSGENDASLLVYQVEEGRLIGPQHHLSALPRIFQEGDTGSDLHLSPDERFLYVSTRGLDGITVFRIDEGAPVAIQHESTRGNVPRNFCLLGDDLLIAANQQSCSLAFFKRDVDSGRVSFWGTQPTPERPFWVGNEESR